MFLYLKHLALSFLYWHHFCFIVSWIELFSLFWREKIQRLCEVAEFACFKKVRNISKNIFVIDPCIEDEMRLS
mgnify:FL=1